MAEFAGDFELKYLHLHNHEGEGKTPDLRGHNLEKMVIETNIYESIYSSSVTGSLVVVDTENLITNLPIQGTERLSFKLLTKMEEYTSDAVIDCTERSGHPMHIYKLANRQQLTDNTQQYTLYFASREFVRNLRTRVSQTYSGTIDTIVGAIFKEPNYLDSRKSVFLQKTRNQDKITIPNLNPFDAIGLLARKALPDESKGAGYLFYETTKGFHFRTWESLCVDRGGHQRDVKQHFRYVQVPIDRFGHEMLDEDGKPLDKVVENFRNVENYKFLNNFHDVAANTALGTYGHRVITHNIYDKSYKIDDYHYHKSFDKINHTDHYPAIVDSPVDFDTVIDERSGTSRQCGVSDYPEARVTVQPTTRFAHGEDTGSFGTPVEDDGILEGQRISQSNQIHSGTRLQMTIKGQSWLQAGDVIQFDVQSIENRENTWRLTDPQYSGRYIITHIRHRVTTEEYIQVLECAKDGIAEPYDNTGKSFDNIAEHWTPPVGPHFEDID